ncbi:MAG: hydrogenase formation protein HypD [Nitrososphaerota archaeon]|nr:hydrogenase formation protein HypD [Nitrososphaerota archaeon]
MLNRSDLRIANNRFFRNNRELALKIVKIIETLSKNLNRKGVDRVKIMNFCGTHEWTTTHYGLRSILPENIELVAGPGCPVCITPSYYIEVAVKLSLEGIRVYTYGDAYKLPAVKSVKEVKNLAEARSIGGEVSIVYSLLDAVKDARKDERESVFLAIGFETTYPIYASIILRNIVPRNFSFIVVGRLTPPAARYAVEKVGRVDGIIAPGHVSTVIGGEAWKMLSEDYGIPTVISGFEPIDVLISIAEILKQIYEGRSDVVIEYTRAVSWHGNVLAKKMIEEVFEVCDAAWRGIGFIPNSGYRLRREYLKLDGLHLYGFKELSEREWSYDLSIGCRCGEIILGKIKPVDCPLFLNKCTPNVPYGPCMVSSEGTCSIWARSRTGWRVK